MATTALGDIVGEMALLEKGTRSASAVAGTDVTVVPIDQKRFTFSI